MTTEVSGFLVAAHELKAPLALMRQLALSLDLADDQPTRSRLQSELVATSERALRQVNDLSKIARLEDGLFATEPVSVRGVGYEVLDELAPLFASQACQVVPHFSNKSRLAVANRDLLRSILYNFCINAVHYSDCGSTSELSIADHRDNIRLAVRDFGPALPSSIYQSLRQGTLDQPTAVAMRPGSSGLGLYIASQFARHMGAHLGAIRHRDGTSFYVELPTSKQATLWP